MKDKVLLTKNKKLYDSKIFKLGDLVTVSSRPSTGKTTFCKKLILDVVNNNDVYAMMFSLEHLKKSIEKDILEIDNSKKTMSRIIIDDKPNPTIDYMSRIIIDDKPNPTIDYITDQIKKYASTCDLKLVVIDYLQLISFENIKIEEKKTIEILKILKSLATDLNICIVVLHQFGAKESLVEENIKSNNLNQMAIFSKYGNLVFCEPDNKMEYDYAENIIIIKNQ